MVYAREIDDSFLIQLIILFALNEAEKPITGAQLDKLVLENCIINFADYSIAMETLEELEYIHEIKNESIYRITEEGMQTLGFFRDRIPGYVRESIKESVAPMFLEERRKNSIRTELLPFNEMEFMSKCGIYEGEKPLMNLELYAGNREEAEKICSAFKKNSSAVYNDIIQVFKEIVENS
ncbi:MAG: DUF4364 family protein [Oscillospiraceae bacterium]|nr:DUF4364 family protein [Oscillospiraceae bacterium]